MSQHPEAASAQALLDEMDDEGRDQPTIVLDVDALEATPSTTNAAAAVALRTLPDELTGMYYHG